MELVEDIVFKHDQLMIEMKNIKKIKNTLSELDENFDVEDTMKNLDDAHKSMMNFMKEFSDEFSFDKYPMNKNTYQNLDKIDIKSVNDRLNEFSKYINNVSEKFSSSISQGNKILDVTSK
tara:strand:- start:545 stop:904 length:360 start_codon:yes stop_codon:yes gene_type:complete